MSEDLSAEDAKLVTLARGARARIASSTGAALRDETGRTYAAADVALPSMTLSALQLAVAQAVASGSRGVEAAVIIVDDPLAAIDATALADLAGADTVLLVCAGDGSLMRRATAGQPG